MKVMSLRMDEGLYARLKEAAGARGISRLVIALLEKGVDEGVGINSEDDTKVGIKKEEIDTKFDTKDDTKEPDVGIKLMRASELPAVESLAGYTCTFPVRGGMCGKDAEGGHWHGRMARCKEH